MIIDFVLIFFIVRHLRVNLKASEYFEYWNDKLLWAMYGSIAMIVADVLLSSIHGVTIWVGQAALLALIYILYTKPEFKSAKPVWVAIAPYILISLFTNIVKLVLPELYKSVSALLNTINIFTIIWAFGVWIVTTRQRKELAKAQKNVEEQKETNKIVTAMKAELEVQVAERTAELTRQKEELEITLHELKSTQAQLIQSEKMASLGALAAGIAHEIQNPLNFVNNFSEVNSELIEELEQEIDKGNLEDVKIIAKDLKDNEQKILHHGKRADAIVKGMLQHSRASTGKKEPTDINALADEYLQLSYHGMRAKDKTFNATLQTDFDSSVGKINVVPQDIGRVLLNLFNNAFYAVTEKAKQQTEEYKPTVFVYTKKVSGKTEVHVKDNGIGIPQKVVDKIFQPFFTTKPTGQGTGLGLSLSYDIIKAHGGEIKVETKEGEGSEFIIKLLLV